MSRVGRLGRMRSSAWRERRNEKGEIRMTMRVKPLLLISNSFIYTYPLTYELKIERRKEISKLIL
jgi:hypothetical protein